MTYKVIVDDKHDVTKLVETITLKDSLDQIAYQANIRLAVSASSGLPAISPGMPIRISGVPFGGKSMVHLSIRQSSGKWKAQTAAQNAYPSRSTTG